MIPQDGSPVRPAMTDPGLSDDPRILDLMKEYEAEWERGQRPARSRFVNRYPDLSAVVPICLDGIDLLYREVMGLTRSDRRAARSETGLVGGSRVGELEIVREIGRGGMGVVYEAVQHSLNRRVAVKVLPRTLAADQSRLRRFEVEARAAAAVNHPHIVPVHGVGEDRGMNYYVMRLVDGSPLDTLIADMRRPGGSPELGPLPSSGAARSHPSPEEFVALSRGNRPAFHRAAARLGAVIARALDHAHENGVVHRDVKPANLLLGRDGHVWVTDFGLARFAEAANVTGTGTAVGTLRYMSPEQAAGDRRKLDHRTDVYSLAATLYELLTGRPAFPAEEPAKLLQQIAHASPPRPRAIDPTVPADLETVLMKGLEKDSRDRYSTAAEFADDLERFLDGRPVAARRPSPWDKARKWAGRHPATIGCAVAFLLILALTSSLIVALALRAYRAERNRANEAEQRVVQSKRLSNLMIQISEEECQANVSLSTPRRRLLQAALENYRQLYKAERDDPQARAELARMTARLESLLAEEKAIRESWPVGLLWFQSVRAELGLSAEQEERLARAFRNRGLEPGAAGVGLQTVRNSLALRDKLFRLLTDPALRDEILLALTEPQRKRLEQLLVQFLGSLAFNFPEVVEPLALTPQQQQQIRLLQPLTGYRFGPQSVAVQALQRREGALPNDDMNKILGLLTPEQRKAWDALTGKPF